MLKTVMLRTTVGMVSADAICTTTPGIVITMADGNPGYYRLTHEQSGMCVTGGRSTYDVFALMRLAGEVGALGDWSADAATVNRTVNMGALKAALDGCGAPWEYHPPSDAVKAASKEYLSAG